MQSELRAIQEAGAEILAISVDSVDENAKVASKMGLEFRVLSDPDLKVVDAYGLRHETARGPISRPAVFILDREGTVRWRHFTDNWRIRLRPDAVLEQLAKIP